MNFFPSVHNRVKRQGTGCFSGYYTGPSGKELPAHVGDAGDPSSIPGSGRSPGGGNGNSFQYSCLENFLDRGAWWAIVHGVEELDTAEQPNTTHNTRVNCNIWETDGPRKRLYEIVDVFTLY